MIWRSCRSRRYTPRWLCHEVGQHDFNARGAEAARKVTSVPHTDLLLQAALVAFPRCGVITDHEVAEVVDINHGGPRCRLGQGQGGRALPGGGRPGQQESWTHRTSMSQSAFPLRHTAGSNLPPIKMRVEIEQRAQHR